MDPNPFSELNYWAIVASAVAAFVLGGAWYRINAGYHLAQHTFMGVILGLWH